MSNLTDLTNRLIDRNTNGFVVNYTRKLFMLTKIHKLMDANLIKVNQDINQNENNSSKNSNEVAKKLISNIKVCQDSELFDTEKIVGLHLHNLQIIMSINMMLNDLTTDMILKFVEFLSIEILNKYLNSCIFKNALKAEKEIKYLDLTCDVYSNKEKTGDEILSQELVGYRNMIQLNFYHNTLELVLLWNAEVVQFIHEYKNIIKKPHLTFSIMNDLNSFVVNYTILQYGYLSFLTQIQPDLISSNYVDYYYCCAQTKVELDYSQTESIKHVMSMRKLISHLNKVIRINKYNNNQNNSNLSVDKILLEHENMPQPVVIDKSWVISPMFTIVEKSNLNN